MGRQVHKGDRKPKGFWDGPEVMKVFAEFLEGKVDREEAYRRLEIDHYGEPMATKTFDWYLRHRYLPRTRRPTVAFSDGAATVERLVMGDGGRLVIPARYRRALGLNDGDELIMWLDGDDLRVLTPRKALRYAQALVRRYVSKGRSLVDELTAERRQEARRE